MEPRGSEWVDGERRGLQKSEDPEGACTVRDDGRDEKGRRGRKELPARDVGGHHPAVGASLPARGFTAVAAFAPVVLWRMARMMWRGSASG